jgi:hypothetical protein
MKKFTPLTLQANRIRTGQYGSDESFGLAGAFRLIAPGGTLLLALSSGPDGGGNNTGWEHVSASAEQRPPTWDEMCFVKNIFWDDQECVVQYHPPKSDYVNFHPNVLHLWRPVSMSIPMPPVLLVGPRTK